MAMTYVASASADAATGSSQIVITKPTGTASGDVLVVALTANKNTWSVPSGFTLLQTGEAADSTAFRSYLYYKVAGGSEPASYTFTKNTDTLSPLVGTMIAIRGCNTASPIMDSDVEVIAGVTSNNDPNATISVTRSSAPSRILMWRTNRNTNTFSPTFSESSGGWDIGVQDVGGTGGTRYGSCVIYTGDFGTLGDTTGPAGGITCNTTTSHDVFFMVALSGVEPAEGTMTAQVPSVSSQFAGSRVMPDGPMDATVPKVSAEFTGTAAPPEGTLDTVLPKVSASFEGSGVGGAVAATLPSITSLWDGGVEPIGLFTALLPSLTSAFTGETRPFGEQVIAVEADHRSFRVVDDGTERGLIPIKRSQVTEA